LLKLRKSKERGHTKLSWLDSWHTFSFDSYYDPAYEHYGPLRVINDDIVAPSAGFPTHPHRDMEILTYVLEGELAHKDSLGNGSVIVPGELQYMSAGKGIQHSEYNPSSQNFVRLLQIWIMPNKEGLNSTYDQKAFDIEYGGGWQLLASPNSNGKSIRINQDVFLYAAKLNSGEQIQHKISPGRKIWLQMAQGSLQCNKTEMLGGDGASLEDLSLAEIKASASSHVLLFDLPS
jgi:redox-sensitive bicupin YhaK (pirin superfamily)